MGGPEASRVLVQAPLKRVKQHVFIKVEIVGAEDIGTLDVLSEFAENGGQGLALLLRHSLGDAVDFGGFWGDGIHFRANDMVLGSNVVVVVEDHPADTNDVTPVTTML